MGAVTVLSGMFAAAVGVGLAPAYAVGGSCRAYEEKKSQSFQPDAYRVRAICSSLQSDTKARGVLMLDAAPDETTVWFTGLNINRYSAWTTKWAWQVNGVKIELAEK